MTNSAGDDSDNVIYAKFGADHIARDGQPGWDNPVDWSEIAGGSDTQANHDDEGSGDATVLQLRPSKKAQ